MYTAVETANAAALPIMESADSRESAPRAVVIGAGIGGLAAAMRLGARGYRVTVVDKLDGPGGRAYVYRRDGFTFDAGPTIITAPFLLEELWQLCGRKLADDVELREMSPYYRINFDDGYVFDYSGDLDFNREQIRRLNPDDVAGYDRYLVACEQIYEIAFERFGCMRFDNLWDMAKVVPAAMRLGGFRSVYGQVSRFVRDPRLRIVLSFHPLLIGGSPLRTSAFYTLISHLEKNWGVHSVMGGTGALVRGMQEVIQSQGGRFRFGCQVKEIMVENGAACGIRLADDAQLRADIVVSNADAAFTYRHLLPARHRRTWTDRRLDNASYSMGLFVWYFGTDRRYESVPHHSLVLGPRYHGLLRDIFRRKVLAEDASLYLHRPTATDPSMAPEGCDCFYVLSPVPNCDAGIDWAGEGERYRQRIQAQLEQSVLPHLGKHLVSSHFSTPEDFRSRLLALRGAAFSLEPLLRQSAWFRPHNRSEEVDRLYLVGAGTHPGAGLPGVLTSASLLDDMVPDAQLARA